MTRFAGQPMLISTMRAPAASAMRTPSAIERGIAAGELNDMRLDARAFGAQLGLHVAFHQFVGHDHLGHDEAGAQPLGGPTEGDVRDARERRQDGAGRYRHAADAEAPFAYFLISSHCAQ